MVTISWEHIINTTTSVSCYAFIVTHHGSDIYLGMSLIQNGGSYLMY